MDDKKVFLEQYFCRQKQTIKQVFQVEQVIRRQIKRKFYFNRLWLIEKVFHKKGILDKDFEEK